MRANVTVKGDLEAGMALEVQAGKMAVTGAVSGIGGLIKQNWRGQVRAAELGGRLANAIRHEVYPTARPSFNAAAFVFTRAPKIIAAFESGALIVAAGGAWLAIPLPAAGKGPGGKKITPTEWKAARGMELRFVQRKSGAAYLVAEGRLATGEKTAGLARRKGGKRRKDGILSGETSIPVFVLVPQVRLAKRLNLLAAADQIAGRLASDVVRGWR